MPKRLILSFLILCLLLSTGCSRTGTETTGAEKTADAAERPSASSVPAASRASSPTPSRTPAPTPVPTPVTVAGQTAENGVLQAVVEAEDFALIEQIPDLKTLDVTGSVCYDAILAYRDAHPEVTVLYSVMIGDKAIGCADSAAEVTDVSDPTMFSYLPALHDLTVTEPLSAAQAAAVRLALPDAALTFSVTFAGLTVPSDATFLDLSEVSPSLAGEVAEALAVLSDVTDVTLNRADGSSDWTLEDAGVLQAVRTSLRVDLNVTVFNRHFSLTDDVINFNSIGMTPERKETLLSLLPYLRSAGRLDMEYCGLPDEEMAALRAQYPSPKIVWRVKVGAYSCRTDAQMIRFSMFYKLPMLTDYDTKSLVYCNEVRYLDLGHNQIRDTYFVSSMPELEVCIIAVRQPTYISAFANCPHLEYLELFNGSIDDISALANCKELRHLNICMNKITDITPLYGLTKLERLWISRNPIPEEQLARFRELVPNCIVNTTVENPTDGGWRKDSKRPSGYAERYERLRKQFMYGQNDVITTSYLPDCDQP